MCWEYPKSLNFAQRISQTMEESAAKYCKAVPIPAEPAIGNHWIH